MKHFKRQDILTEVLPGRIIQKAVGADGFVLSSKMTVGFAHYSAESSAMEPHRHAEEVCYIVDARDGWVRYGPTQDRLDVRVDLEAGMILHNPPMEWHVFEYDEGGFVDIIFIYGQVDNIRPEENLL